MTEDRATQDKTLTDEFVEFFGDPERKLRSPLGWLIGKGRLPDGVDEDDPRVKALIEKYRKATIGCGVVE